MGDDRDMQDWLGVQQAPLTATFTLLHAGWSSAGKLAKENNILSSSEAFSPELLTGRL